MNQFKLDNEPKINSGFKIPEHYFDDFSSGVMLKLPENESKVVSVFAERKNWFFIAAAILTISLLIPIVSKYNSQKNELDQKTIENYLTYNTKISDDELVEYLDESDIEKLKSDYSIEDDTVEDILSANPNLEEYCID